MRNKTNQKALEFIHPGILLKQDLEELSLTKYFVSKQTGISQVNLSKILKGERSITPDTGLRLAKFLGVSENYFINMQKQFDTQKAKEANKEIYDLITTYPPLSRTA